MLQLQGRWKDPAMPLKYARDRGLIPIASLSALAADVRKGWRPGRLQQPTVPGRADSQAAAYAGAAEEQGPSEHGSVQSGGNSESEVSDLDDGPTEITFWEPAPGTNLTRVHVLGVGSYDKMACGAVTINQCTPAGAPPLERDICKNCVRVRPEALLGCDA